MNLLQQQLQNLLQQQLQIQQIHYEQLRAQWEDAAVAFIVRKMAVVDRTCTTCSKTCDVGKKCWWCGNGE